jgi:hypothetical protein
VYDPETLRIIEDRKPVLEAFIRELERTRKQKTGAFLNSFLTSEDKI